MTPDQVTATTEVQCAISLLNLKVIAASGLGVAVVLSLDHRGIINASYVFHDQPVQKVKPFE